MSNQRNLGNALVLFTEEHQGFLPKAWFNDGPIGSGISGKMTWEYRFPRYGWDYLLLGYVGKNRELFRCPSDDPGRFRGDPHERRLARVGLHPGVLPDEHQQPARLRRPPG